MSSLGLTRLSGWPLWRRQVLAVMRLELAKGFSLGRSLWLFFLAFAPTLIIGAHALKDRGCSLPPGPWRSVHARQCLCGQSEKSDLDRPAPPVRGDGGF